MKYCSIDLEFTGFDPETEQILEVGFAFFDIQENQVVIGEKWSQVFRPTIDVHPKILGLTGITQEEVDVAPEIGEFKDFLTEKLRDKILVAHNPTLDIKFLKQAGVELSGRVIDTLELVQFILPTHHSYNLENLMHYFDIKHQESHRALGDSLSTIALLEHLLKIHQSFPDELKEQILQVCSRADFEWTALLQWDIGVLNEKLYQDSLATTEFANDVIKQFDEPIVIDDKHFLHESRVANTLQRYDQKSLLVFSSKQEVIRLWQAGLVEAVFSPDDLYNSNAFKYFFSQAQTPEELRFCLKILVWEKTNWQTKTILDLNLSFFGGQFKIHISGGEYISAEQKIIACDYTTFIYLANQKLETYRHLIVCDMQRFERYLTFGSQQRLSWNYFNFVVKSIYNPDTGFGAGEYENKVIELLASIDLFFGLVQIILRQSRKQLSHVALKDMEILQPVYYRRLIASAKHLASKLIDLGQTARHQKLGDLASELSNFFVTQENMVKWVELTEDNVVMHSQPIKIDFFIRPIFDLFSSVKLTETLINKELLFYLVERLGFNAEIIKNTNILIKHKTESIKSKVNLLDVITTTSMPIVVVFQTPAHAKTFYKDNYLSLSGKLRVYAQEYSGSGNKIFRNFSIEHNSLLLATSQFINKQKYLVQAKTVIYLGNNSLDVSLPYFEALVENYSDTYPNLVKLLEQSEYILNIKQLSKSYFPEVIMLEDPNQ